MRDGTVKATTRATEVKNLFITKLQGHAMLTTQPNLYTYVR